MTKKFFCKKDSANDRYIHLFRNLLFSNPEDHLRGYEMLFLPQTKNLI